MYKFLLVFIVALLLKNDCKAQYGDSCDKRCYDSKFEPGIEYMYPIDKDRHIETISLNVFYWKKYFKKIKLNVNIGITATYAWGNIIQWDNNFKDVRHQNTAFGAGPVLGLQLTLLSIGRISLEGESNGGLILYSNKFPYGGDIYNFMWRRGVNIEYRINQTNSIKLGYRFMHVSNGQGLGPHNPSYEARGINFSVVNYFY